MIREAVKKAGDLWCRSRKKLDVLSGGIKGAGCYDKEDEEYEAGETP